MKYLILLTLLLSCVCNAQDKVVIKSYSQNGEDYYKLVDGEVYVCVETQKYFKWKCSDRWVILSDYIMSKYSRTYSSAKIHNRKITVILNAD